MSGSFLTGPLREADQCGKRGMTGGFFLVPFEGLCLSNIRCNARHVSDRLYIRAAVGGEGQKKRQGHQALPLVKSLVY